MRNSKFIARCVNRKFWCVAMRSTIGKPVGKRNAMIIADWLNINYPELASELLRDAFTVLFEDIKAKEAGE